MKAFLGDNGTTCYSVREITVSRPAQTKPGGSRMSSWSWRRCPAAVAAIFLLFSISACGLVDPGPPPPKIHWQTLARGKALAAERRLPCLVDFFYGPGCPRCDRFINEIYSDPGIVARIEAGFIPIRINLAAPLSVEEKSLAEKMSTGGECMLMFLDHRGEVVKREKGLALCSLESMGAREFAAILEEAGRLSKSTAQK